MTTDPVTTTTRDEIRQAVAFGKQAAVREILDLLRKKRPQRDGWVPMYEDGIPTSMGWYPDLHGGEQDGYDEAVRVVKGYRIDPTEEPTP